MAYLIEQATRVANAVLVAVLIILFIVGFFFLQSKRKRKKNIREEHVDYSGLSRKDTRDYIKLDDIRNEMIVLDKGRRFIGVIRCFGFDFYAESAAVQYKTCENFFGFINTINKPITYRQYSKPVDMDYTVKRYQKAYEDVVEQIYNLTEDISDLQSTVSNNRETLDQADLALYEQNIESGKRQLEALKFRQFHLEDQLRVLDILSGTGVAPEIMETWVFEWVYDPLNYSVSLSEREVEEKAIRELNSIARAKIHALENCGVKARRCSTEELIEMYRRYSSPISADVYKTKDILDSSFFEDVVTSHSLEDLEQEAADYEAIEASKAFEKSRREFEKEVQAAERLKQIEQNALRAEASLKENRTGSMQVPVRGVRPATQTAQKKQLTTPAGGTIPKEKPVQAAGAPIQKKPQQGESATTNILAGRGAQASSQGKMVGEPARPTQEVTVKQEGSEPSLQKDDFIVEE